MKCCDKDPRSFFLCGASKLFGAWLLYAGIAKFAFMGPSNFVGYITGQFANTWSPTLLTTGLAWIILIAEPILGVLLLLGKKSRCVWTATTLLMFLLTFGQTILMKENVADNWIYTIFCLACAALSSNEDSGSCAETGEKTGCCSKD